MESKKLTYSLIPQQYYSPILSFTAHASFNQVNSELRTKNFEFPVIAKPDKGCRGFQVEIIKDEKQLLQYIEQNEVDFLIQKFLPYKNEVGIFYYRMPTYSKGTISGINAKKFLAVKGDGKSTIEDLIVKDSRSFLQYPSLKKNHGELMNHVLPLGKEQVLVPYGNHRRGAEFIDLSLLINPKLTSVIDDICKQIPQFYFGRLDIMYDSWDELCNGKNLSIVELNGAGSEPTHIYDSSNSIFYAWKEIRKHWKILYQISKLNKNVHKLNYMSAQNGMQLIRKNLKQMQLISPLVPPFKR